MTTLRVIAGSADPDLADTIANYAGAGPADTVVERFPHLGTVMP